MVNTIQRSGAGGGGKKKGSGTKTGGSQGA